MHEEARAILPLLLDAWHADAPVLIGHSDGASIALIHAAENAVTALVCLAPRVFVEDTCLDSIREAKASFDRGAARADGPASSRRRCQLLRVERCVVASRVPALEHRGPAFRHRRACAAHPGH
jgi:pimeloyl-ACP methyl ester carboxylesterase